MPPERLQSLSSPQEVRSREGESARAPIRTEIHLHSLLSLDTFVENIRVALLSTRRLLSRGRDWSARARDALCARGAAADVAMLEALVAESSSLPLRLADAEGLSASVALIKSWKGRSQRALQVKTDLREVVALVQDGEQFPFLAQQPEHGELQAKAHSAARLLAQLIEVLPSKRSRSDSSSKLLWSKV